MNECRFATCSQTMKHKNKCKSRTMCISSTHIVVFLELKDYFRKIKKRYFYGGDSMKSHREVSKTQEYYFEERCYIVSRSFGKDKTINDLIKDLITNRNVQAEPCK